MASYYVPAGYRAVVRSIVGWSELATSGLTLYIGGKTPWLWSAPGAYTAVAQALHAVAYAGEEIGMYRNVGRTGGIVSGYIFEDLTGPVGRQVERQDVATPLPGLRTAQT
jgi:hypothetical protein